MGVMASITLVTRSGNEYWVSSVYKLVALIQRLWTEYSISDISREIHDATGRGDKALNNLLVIEKALGVSFVLRKGVVVHLELFGRGTTVLGPVAE